MLDNTSTEPLVQCNCPQCKKIIQWNDDFPFRPFCSERCKLIDLGEWASEGHFIAGNSVMPDENDE